MFILCLTALLKCFVYSQVRILDYPWYNNPCYVYQELDHGDFYLFHQKFIISSKLSTFNDYLEIPVFFIDEHKLR